LDQEREGGGVGDGACLVGEGDLEEEHLYLPAVLEGAHAGEAATAVG